MTAPDLRAFADRVEALAGPDREVDALIRCAVFARRNDQCHRFGARLVILRREKGPDGRVHNIRGFLDEIPANQSTKVRGADLGGCGFHCNSERTAA